jgi:MFS transporter, DHA1 family, multidrug resistance protein
LAAQLGKRLGVVRVLGGFSAVSLLAATALLLVQPAGLTVVLPILWLFVTACGGCFPGSAALALRNQAAQAGTASSTYGFLNFTCAGLISPVPGVIGISGVVPVAGVLVFTSCVSLLGVELLARVGRPRS